MYVCYVIAAVSGWCCYCWCCWCRSRLLITFLQASLFYYCSSYICCFDRKGIIVQHWKDSCQHHKTCDVPRIVVEMQDFLLFFFFTNLHPYIAMIVDCCCCCCCCMAILRSSFVILCLICYANLVDRHSKESFLCQLH